MAQGRLTELRLTFKDLNSVGISCSNSRPLFNPAAAIELTYPLRSIIPSVLTNPGSVQHPPRHCSAFSYVPLLTTTETALLCTLAAVDVIKIMIIIMGIMIVITIVRIIMNCNILWAQLESDIVACRTKLTNF